MGWNSADEIVEPVIRTLIMQIDAGWMEERAARNVLKTLICACQEHDWDTQDETLEAFTDHAWVVDAFALAGVPCDNAC